MRTGGVEPNRPLYRNGAAAVHGGMSCLSCVEKAGIEPARQRLQGAPGALPVIPRAAAPLIIL
jgi:hypothetical protein